MRIDRIEIKNFRQYRDVTFEFKNTGNEDLHIILGKNGMGKTNLLNAITWCLYDQEFHLGNRESSMPMINLVAYNEAKDNREQTINVEVNITVSSDVESIIYSRKKTFTINKNNRFFDRKSEFIVTTMKNNGETKVYDNSDDTKKMINRYLPEPIREYFFFDGEHLDKYFLDDRGENIKQAIYNISQVNLLTKMKDRLATVISELEKNAGKKNKGIGQLTENKEELEKLLKNKNDEKEELEKQISLSKYIVKENREFLRSSEGLPEKEKELESLKAQIKQNEYDLDSIDKELKHFIITYKIIFEFYDSIKCTLEIIESKEEEGALPPIIDKIFLKKMLENHKCLVCNRSLNAEEEKEIEDLIDQLKVTSKTSNLLNRLKGSLQEYQLKVNKYPAEKQNILDRKKRLEKEKEVHIEKFNEIESYIQSFSNRNEILKKHIERNKHEELISINNQKLGCCKSNLGEIKKELEEIQKKINKAIQEQQELRYINDKISFAKKSRTIVEEIEQEMMLEVKNKMISVTMDIFKDLLWKKDTYDHIELDENYRLELYHKDGLPCVGSCSAAERALLALSFTLALQQVSGYDSMLFIDTPVGRVDTENRANFAKMLSEISRNKQIIMTFTTSEYSNEIKEVFEEEEHSILMLNTNDERETFLS